MKNVSSNQTLVFAPDGVYTRDQWTIEAYRQVSPELKDKNLAALTYLPAHNGNGGKQYAIRIKGNRVVEVLTALEYEEATGISLQISPTLEQNLPPSVLAQMAAAEKRGPGRPPKAV